MAQYSALRCVSGIWQNSEKPLISNGLSFIFTCLLTAALWGLFHSARHSFGTFLISEGIPIESIAKMMGHSGIKTTQRYAEVTDKKISKDMDNLMAFRCAYGIGASREKKTKNTLTNKEE